MSTTEKAGHTFLANLDKTRLRPGGIEATEQLFSQLQLTPDSQVLEVARNITATATELVQCYGRAIYAIDMGKTALSNVRNDVAADGLEDHIHVMAVSANTLPFADSSFDVVINEAMLTAYADKAEAKLVAEYYHVLKSGGRLLTHDIMFIAQKLGADGQSQLVDMVKSNVSPVTRQGWRDLFLNCGFEQILQQNGNMSLMSPRGLVRDKGLTGAVKIVFNGLCTSESRRRFLKIFRFFRSQRHQLDYITCCSVKGR